ncbi:MAG TPA: TRAP transporter small permease subunit [Rhodocyclaceae bacterium]|nr:TRAP transporter small permease subunit [Rhodocyclaceae bacterium]
MQGLLKFSALVDAFNERIGKGVVWLVLAAVLVSAVNAGVRKAFNTSSNAFLELQWYLFSAIFLLGAAYALRRNEHVRIDVVSGYFTKRARIWVELAGSVLFLLPMSLGVLYLSWPVFVNSYLSHEMSNSAGGLIVWPARLLVPAGFLLLSLQGVSQAIKCAGFLAGACPDPTEKERKVSSEEELAEAIRRQRAAGDGKGGH